MLKHMLKHKPVWAIALYLIFHAAAQADNLYQPDQYKALVTDTKAYKVGDNITVLVYENASSTTTAGTSSDKSSGFNFAAKSHNFDTHSIDQSAHLDMGNQAQGKGKIERSGKLLAQLTVTVVSIEPTGLLVVSGDQVINVNDEKQEIKLEGKVRRSDINENNTVLSTRLSNAKISYTGDGILGDRQRPGIITRILNWLGAM
jgi:flagellar L-ring protein precursor FlgH